jgi:DNA-binding transcriptional regulator YiaG
MSTLAVALKDEIRRLARKEIKAQTGTTVRAVAQYRREIARLKRQVREQDKKIASLASQKSSRGVAAPEAGQSDDGVRFSARSAKAQRRRTGLSAADYGKLVGVSPLTIYNWEHGKSRPRRQQFAALVGLRGIGKREAIAKLSTLNGKPSSRRGRRASK